MANNTSTEIARYQTLIYNAICCKIDPKILEEQLKKIYHDAAIAIDPVTDTELTRDDLVSMIMMHQFIAESVGLSEELCTCWSAEELFQSFDYKSLRDMQTAYAFKIGAHMAITSALLDGITQVAGLSVDEKSLAAYIASRSQELGLAVKQ